MDSKDRIRTIKYFGNFCWFVIQTKPRDEHRVKTHLLNQEIETFLPLFGTHQYRNGKMVRTIKPLFPNYLFSRLDLTLQYYKGKWTRGVSKILGTGDGPVPISEIVIPEKMTQDASTISMAAKVQLTQSSNNLRF